MVAGAGQFHGGRQRQGLVEDLARRAALRRLRDPAGAGRGAARACNTSADLGPETRTTATAARPAAVARAKMVSTISVPGLAPRPPASAS